ncbi:SH3 domain-containing protein [Eubacteriales bacterium OttesenSCG-928-A19]|nr:SH3 domain-containing protein [Eubacteriales bacterium OttesenSCG-928-A19]
MRNCMIARHGSAARRLVCAALVLCLLPALGGMALAQTADYLVTGTTNTSLVPPEYAKLETVLDLPLNPGEVIDITGSVNGNANGRSVPANVTINNSAGMSIINVAFNNGTINVGSGYALVNINNGTINIVSGNVQMVTNNGTVNGGSGDVSVANNNGTVVTTGLIMGMTSATLDANNGTFNLTNTQTMRLAHSNGSLKLSQAGTITPPAGKTLQGWDTNAAGTTVVYGPTDSVSYTGTLYAVWDPPQTYTLTLYANGGTFPGNASSDDIGPQPSNTFTLSGYATLTPPSGKKLVGWDTNPAAPFPVYYDNAIYIGAGPLYAIWEDLPPDNTGLNSFTLTDANGVTYAAAINGTNVRVNVPHGTDPNSLTATYALSDPLASVNPDPSGHTSWGSGFSFTVTAQDGITQQTYTVSVIVGDAPDSGGGIDFTPIRDAARDAFQPGMVVVNCNEWVNVREGPGEEYAVIGRAYLGEALQVVGEQNGWVECFYSGGDAVGWIRADFVGRL